MQARGLVLDKSHDIAGTIATAWRVLAESILQKPANERHVVGDRCSGQARASCKYCSYAWAQRSAEVSGRADTFFSVGITRSWRRKSSRCRSAAAAPGTPHLPSAVLQILLWMIGGDGPWCDFPLSEPSAKTCSEPNLPLN